MKTSSLLLMVLLCMAGNSHSKPITITKNQIGQTIVLIATNNTTIEYEYELSITSSGLKVNKSLPPPWASQSQGGRGGYYPFTNSRSKSFF